MNSITCTNRGKYAVHRRIRDCYTAKDTASWPKIWCILRLLRPNSPQRRRRQSAKQKLTTKATFLSFLSPRGRDKEQNYVTNFSLFSDVTRSIMIQIFFNSSTKFREWRQSLYVFLWQSFICGLSIPRFSTKFRSSFEYFAGEKCMVKFEVLINLKAL